jgi:hypothetical protein
MCDAHEYLERGYRGAVGDLEGHATGLRRSFEPLLSASLFCHSYDLRLAINAYLDLLARQGETGEDSNQYARLDNVSVWIAASAPVLTAPNWHAVGTPEGVLRSG